MKNLIFFVFILLPSISIAQKDVQYYTIKKQVDSLTKIVILDSKFGGSLDSIYYFYNDRKVGSRNKLRQYNLKKNEIDNLVYRINKENITKRKYLKAHIFIENAFERRVFENRLDSSFNYPVIIRGTTSIDPDNKLLYILTLDANRKNKKLLKKEKKLFRNHIKYRKGSHYEFIIPRDNESLLTGFITTQEIEKIKNIRDAKTIRKYDLPDALNGILSVKFKNANEFLNCISMLNDNSSKKNEVRVK